MGGIKAPAARFAEKQSMRQHKFDILDSGRCDVADRARCDLYEFDNE